MNEITVIAEPREALGKKNGALRRAGITPIHVYGRALESLTLQAETTPLIRAISQAGRTTPLTVKVGSEEHFVVVRNVQRHPVSERLIHVDFLQVSRTQRLQASVPIVFSGEAPGAREAGAMVSEDMHSLDLEALPTDMPSSLAVDLSALASPEAVIRAGDVELAAGVTLIGDPEAVVARVVHRRGADDSAVESEAAESGDPSGSGPVSAVETADDSGESEPAE